ncbi:MAG TPA: hypothetical protein VEG44_04595 [Candidatus Acidoferrales bacterium]|nr:hypothetical protein [Candidatus Acidoferrales bacterium]
MPTLIAWTRSTTVSDKIQRRATEGYVLSALHDILQEGVKGETSRRVMREKFDEELYRRRNLVETVFSV